MMQSKMTATAWVWLVLLVGAGLVARGLHIHEAQLEVDEAESAINALTILNHGYPVDHYMGLPIYENTLIQPWPEHTEYEFRDSSYSDQGVAVYHGWLPLYAIAGAMASFGIGPDHPTRPPRVQHSLEDMRWRNVVPRLPSLVFSAVFLVLMFVAGRKMGGMAAAWTALAFAAFTKGLVEYGSQARYYSATLMLSAACGLTLWLIMERGRWRDFLLYGLLMVLLFHTHVLSCAVLGVVFVLMMPTMLRHERLVYKTLACGVILAAGTLPWILWTGFPGSAADLPAAWTAMDFPGDLWKYSGHGTTARVLICLAATWVLVVLTFHRRLPPTLVGAVLPHRRASVMFLLWGVVALFGFTFLIPLISHFPKRLSQMLAVPGIFLAMLVVSGLARLTSRQRIAMIAPVATLILGVAIGKSVFEVGVPFKHQTAPLLADYFRAQKLQNEARIYTAPNLHLILTYYLGLPVQSIAPVRKSFLDSHEGEVVFIDPVRFDQNWTVERVLTLAASAGEELSYDEARSLVPGLRTYAVRQDLAERLRDSEHPLEELPSFIEAELARQRLDRESRSTGWWSDVLVFKGLEIRNGTDAWMAFFYRFVDPASRGGANANYAERIRNARAVLLPESHCVIFHSPPHVQDKTGR
jgi:hypothetical protein